jgi:hypothetical protein
VAIWNQHPDGSHKIKFRHIHLRHFNVTHHELQNTTWTLKLWQNAFQMMTFLHISLQNVINPFAPKDKLSQCTVWCWENWMSHKVIGRICEMVSGHWNPKFR